MMNKNNTPITIEDLVIHAENDVSNNYNSAEFLKMYHDFAEKLFQLEKETNCGELVESDGGFAEIVCRGQHEYFKAGFCAGVRLLAEALGMNI